MFPLTDSQLFSCIKRMDSDEHSLYRICLTTAVNSFNRPHLFFLNTLVTENFALQVTLTGHQ